jgi:hypothetical protein
MYARDNSPLPFDLAFEKAAEALADSVVDGLAVTHDEARNFDCADAGAPVYPAFGLGRPSEGESTSSTFPVVSVAKKITVNPPMIAQIPKTR